MNEFKKTFTKTYNIQNKNFLFRSLSTKEVSDIEKEVTKVRFTLNNEDECFTTRVIETLARCLVSVDGTQLNKIEDVQVDISKGKNELDSIKAMIGELDSSFTTLLYLYYLEMLKEKDSKYQKETEFLNSLNK